MKKLSLFFIVILFSFSFAKAQSSSCPDDLIPKRFMSNGKMGFVDLFDNWKIKPKYFEVSPFENRFAKVRYGNNYGMINCEGEEVVPPEYDELGFFSFGRIWAKNEQGWYLWDSSGNKLIESPFEAYQRASIWHSFAWVNKEDKWKILNEQNGLLICDKEFTTIKILSDTLSLVSNDSYFGIINHKNCQFKIPESIVHAQKVSSDFIKLHFRNRKYDIINLEGESILKNPYDEIQSAGNGLAKVKSDKKWGLITPRGKEILNIEYDSIKTYHFGRIALQKSGKWFYINEKLFPINDSLYDIASDFTPAGAFVKKENSWSVIDHSGKIDGGPFDSIVYHQNILFVKEESKWKINNGQKDAELFDQINFSDKIHNCRVMQNKEWGTYNFKESKWLIAPSYSNLQFISDDMLIARNKDKTGLIDKSGNILIPLDYLIFEWQPGFRNNLFLVKSDKYKLINEKNKSILDSEKKIRRDASLFIVKDDKKQYLYENDGDLVYEDKVDSIVVLSGSNFFAIRDKEKWGLMDVKGEELIDTDYIFFKVLSEKYIAFGKNEFWEIFKYDGKKLIDEEYKITEIKETFDNSFIVNTNKGLLWIANTSKLLEKDFSEYHVLNSGQVAIQKSQKWVLKDKEAHSISNTKFDSIDKKTGSEILRTGSKSFIINTKDQISIYLPFN